MVRLRVKRGNVLMAVGDFARLSTPDPLQRDEMLSRLLNVLAAGNMSPQAMAYILNEPVQNIVYDPGDLAIEAELDDDLAALAAGHNHYGKNGKS